jgi:hypothetical protein
MGAMRRYVPRGINWGRNGTVRVTSGRLSSENVPKAPQEGGGNARVRQREDRWDKHVGLLAQNAAVFIYPNISRHSDGSVRQLDVLPNVRPKNHV